MATTPSVIESGAELAASVPSDFFNDIGGEVSVGAEEAPESESGDETTGDAAIETLETPAAVEDAPLKPVGAEEPVVEAAEEPTPAAAPEKPVAEVKPGEELPEGVVKGKDRKLYKLVKNRKTGKQEWVSHTDLLNSKVLIPDE